MAVLLTHLDDVPEVEGSYPAPFDQEKLTLYRDLGRALGSKTLGFSVERLLPGRRSSFTHAHSAEEEFVYVLSGTCHVRVIEPGSAAREIALRPGHAVSFVAGTGIAHTFVNHGTEECTLFVAGERRPGFDRVFYAEDDAFDEHHARAFPERHWSYARSGDTTMTRNPKFALDRNNAALLVIDVQERLGAAMDPARFARSLKNTQILVESAKTLGLPILATEQYPKGLGPTVPSLRDALPAAPSEKVAFSCVAVDEVAKKLAESGRKQVIVAGMETHVCVFQTVRDSLGDGYVPFVPRDAVLSRTEENHETGLALMKEGGATITSTEAVVFDLLGAAGTPEFKKLSPLVK